MIYSNAKSNPILSARVHSNRASYLILVMTLKVVAAANNRLKYTILNLKFQFQVSTSLLANPVGLENKISIS